MIVSMKQHGSTGVAKVVNPLGTVVTVHHIDDAAANVDCKSEEAIIHENCDEALFRPVVAPKSLHYADRHLRGENKHLIDDRILTKNLKSTTEIPFKISNTNNEYDKEPEVQVRSGKNKRIKESLSKHGKSSVKSETDLELTHNTHNNNDSEVSSVDSSHKNKALNNKHVVKMSFAEFSQKSDSTITKGSSSELLKDFLPNEPGNGLREYKIPPLLSDNLLKMDDFQDAQELCGEKHAVQCKKFTKMLKNERPQLLERDAQSSSEDNVIEEKNVSKKPRKPKPKLGVRIPSVVTTDQKTNEETAEVVVAPTKKSWNSVVATTKTNYEEPQISQLINTSPVEIDLIEIFDDSDSVELKKECESGPKYLLEDLDTSKTEKSSDDEKVSGSQTETTESDDSIKRAAILADGIDDNAQFAVVVNSNNQIKSTKRKSKKKKK